MKNKNITSQKPRQSKELNTIAYKALFQKAYALMNESIIEGNCGELCGYHCCRPSDSTDAGRLGMYLLPLEFECMQSDTACNYEIHSNQLYDMPPRIKRLYYIYCREAEGCLRDLRPIQCRTYPFEPHLENDVFSLVIEKDQIHECPLLNKMSTWRQAFIDGIYDGWIELLKIPLIKYYVQYDSLIRIQSDNIAQRYTREHECR